MKISESTPQAPALARGSRTAEILTIVAAFLLQWLLLLIGKWILPWFSGAAAVWVHVVGVGIVVGSTGCLLWFSLTGRLSGVTVKIPMLALLFGLLASLPAAPGGEWGVAAPEDPAAHILKLLLVKAGPAVFALSYFIGGRIFSARMISIDAPVLVCRAALLGSIVSVLAFIFFLDPLLTNNEMNVGFSWSVLLFALFGGWHVWREPGGRGAEAKTRSSVSRADCLVQTGLAGSSVALLLVVSSRLQRDAVSDPVFWVTALAIFLACLFANLVLPGVRNRKVYVPLLVLGFILLIVSWFIGFGWSFKLRILINSVALVAGCLACFGELTRKAEGAALDGVLVRFCLGAMIAVMLGVFVAPGISTGYTEFPVTLFALGAFVWLSVVLNKTADAKKKPSRSLALVGGGIAVVLLGAALGFSVYERVRNVVGRIRTFYGVTSSVQIGTPSNGYVVMMSGDYPRAAEFTSSELQVAPAFWQGPVTGVGKMFTALPKGNFRNIGVLGVGNGGLLGYLDASDKITFYENDAGALVTAERQFEYLPNAIIEWGFVPGDPRLSLSDLDPQKFDVLILDVFNSESLPTHLLTKEAFAIWKQHLAENGVVAINVTNQKFDLVPVVWRQALEAGWQTVLVVNPNDPANLSAAAEWMLLTNDRQFIANGKFPVPSPEMSETARQFPLWTDESSNPLSLIK